jgi:hypothetical protein
MKTMTVGDLRKLIKDAPDHLKVVTPGNDLIYRSATGAGIVDAERYQRSFASAKMLAGGLKAKVFLINDDIPVGL